MIVTGRCQIDLTCRMDHISYDRQLNVLATGYDEKIKWSQPQMHSSTLTRNPIQKHSTDARYWRFPFSVSLYVRTFHE